MANELLISYPTGATLYALLFDATGQIWNGSAFAAPGSAAWTDYDIAMTEVATATGIYRASMPAAAAGVYGWVVYQQKGGSPAVTDGPPVGTGRIEWDGTAEIMPASTTNITGGTINSVSSTISANIVQIDGATEPIDNLVSALGNSDGITAHPQGIADALKLAPKAGDPATGSVYDSLAGPISAQLADGVIHGGWNSYLLLKSLDIRNTDVGGLAIYVLANDAIIGGRAIQVDGTGLSKAIEINGVFDADLSGTIAGLTADAQQDVADALKLAPTAGDPATGSVYASLSTLTGASSVLDEPLADHNIAGTAGAKLNDIVANNVTVVADPDPGALEFVVGVTFDHTLEDLVIPSTWTACYFTLKSDKNSQADSASLIQIKVSNPAGGGDGLLRLTGSAPASPITAADASLVVSQAAGTVRIIVSDDALALLTGGLSGLEYDLKVKQSGGSSTRIAIDEASIEWTPTRTV